MGYFIVDDVTVVISSPVTRSSYAASVRCVPSTVPPAGRRWFLALSLRRAQVWLPGSSGSFCAPLSPSTPSSSAAWPAFFSRKAAQASCCLCPMLLCVCVSCFTPNLGIRNLRLRMDKQPTQGPGSCSREAREAASCVGSPGLQSRRGPGRAEHPSVIQEMVTEHLSVCRPLAWPWGSVEAGVEAGAPCDWLHRRTCSWVPTGGNRC